MFEPYSLPDTELVEFHDTKEVHERYPSPDPQRRHVLLQLWPTKASRSLRITRLKLDPLACDGHTFRHRVEGWGLIQLYLDGVSESGIRHSHTGHYSAKGASGWEGIRSEVAPAEDWDFTEVARVSRRLNRHIQKIAVGRILSRPVLPGAAALIERGAVTLPLHENGPPFVRKSAAGAHRRARSR